MRSKLHSLIRKITIETGEIPVEVFHQKVKTYHIGVYPSDGRRHISAPLHMVDHAVRTAVAAWLLCIRQKYAGLCHKYRRIGMLGKPTGEIRFLFLAGF